MTPKYRAWDTKKKIMLEVKAIDWTSNKLFGEYVVLDKVMGEVAHRVQGVQIGFHRVEWLPFTGKKDIHGEEIFKGDIIKRGDCWNNGKQGEDVFWIDWGNFAAMEGDEYEGWIEIAIKVMILSRYPQGFGDYKIEKLGNIYQNPELLK